MRLLCNVITNSIVIKHRQQITSDSISKLLSLMKSGRLACCQLSLHTESLQARRNAPSSCFLNTTTEHQVDLLVPIVNKPPLILIGNTLNIFSQLILNDYSDVVTKEQTTFEATRAPAAGDLPSMKLLLRANAGNFPSRSGIQHQAIWTCKEYDTIFFFQAYCA